MVNCPHCDAVIDVDEDELDEGDTLTCDECGADLSVTGLDPLELETEEDEDEDEEEEDDFDYDEDEDEDEEEEERQRIIPKEETKSGTSDYKDSILSAKSLVDGINSAKTKPLSCEKRKEIGLQVTVAPRSRY